MPKKYQDISPNWFFSTPLVQYAATSTEHFHCLSTLHPFQCLPHFFLPDLFYFLLHIYSLLSNILFIISFSKFLFHLSIKLVEPVKPFPSRPLICCTSSHLFLCLANLCKSTFHINPSLENIGYPPFFSSIVSAKSLVFLSVLKIKDPTWTPAFYFLSLLLTHNQPGIGSSVWGVCLDLSRIPSSYNPLHLRALYSFAFVFKRFVFFLS